MSEKTISTVLERDSLVVNPPPAKTEPRILRVRKIDLEVNDPDIDMCACHCISYCTCNCDRGGLVS
jgi:hypothetical protein